MSRWAWSLQVPPRARAPPAPRPTAAPCRAATRPSQKRRRRSSSRAVALVDVDERPLRLARPDGQNFADEEGVLAGGHLVRDLGRQPADRAVQQRRPWIVADVDSLPERDRRGAGGGEACRAAPHGG